jgi:hypothetical protein
MKNILFIMMASVLLTGCGVMSDTQKILNVHPAAQPYVARFEQMHGQRIDNLEVVFRPIEGNVLGYCQQGTEVNYSDLGLKKTEREIVLIVIDSTYWDPNDSLDNYSDVVNPYTNRSARQVEAADREELMFHELGHCILDRPHTNSRASIMYPYHLGGSNYMNYYSSYVSELFGFTSYAGNAITNDTYASKEFPEFVDRGEEIKLLSAEELAEGDYHETHVEIVTPAQPTEAADQN